jgi:hypothetical protein
MGWKVISISRPRPTFDETEYSYMKQKVTNQIFFSQELCDTESGRLTYNEPFPYQYEPLTSGRHVAKGVRVKKNVS